MSITFRSLHVSTSAVNSKRGEHVIGPAEQFGRSNSFGGVELLLKSAGKTKPGQSCNGMESDAKRRVFDVVKVFNLDQQPRTKDESRVEQLHCGKQQPDEAIKRVCLLVSAR